MSSYPYSELNDIFRALKIAHELQIENLDPRGKIVQKVKFLSISQNSYLSLKSDITCQNGSSGIFDFRNRFPEVHKPKFTQNDATRLTSENAPFVFSY